MKGGWIYRRVVKQIGVDLQRGIDDSSQSSNFLMHVYTVTNFVSRRDREREREWNKWNLLAEREIAQSGHNYYPTRKESELATRYGRRKERKKERNSVSSFALVACPTATSTERHSFPSATVYHSI